jgi:hypothetical protein
MEMNPTTAGVATMIPTLVPTTVYAVLRNGTDGFPVVEAEVVSVRTEFNTRNHKTDIVVEAKSKTTNHTFRNTVTEDLFRGTELHIDLLDAVEESGRKCTEMVARDRKQRAEWNAMSNAEQCAAMGYGVGRYTGD